MTQPINVQPKKRFRAKIAAAFFFEDPIIAGKKYVANIIARIMYSAKPRPASSSIL